MKKILLLSLCCFVVQNVCEARDYAKMHMKEMKKSQKFSATSSYFADYAPEVKTVTVKMKDPKLIKLGNYEEIPKDKLNAKLAKDNAEYKKTAEFLANRRLNEFYMQAYGADFYKVYRVAERIIRANNLNFVNWRIAISSENSFNAYNTETNVIYVNAGALDTLNGNEDALAFLLGHEFAHGLLGHLKREAKWYAKMQKAKRMGSYGLYHIARKRYLAISRNMELVADVEGAKLAAKAGYNLDNAKEVLSYFNTLDFADEWNQTHPEHAKRLKNFEENRLYFMESEWAKQGLFNIYNSDVLGCEKSSNRNSLVINRGKLKTQVNYYQPEPADQLYLRYGYKSYLNGNFKDAIKYFKDYLKIDKSNYAVYLYLSYAYECLYKQNGAESDLIAAREFVGYAKMLAPDDKYVKEQIQAL